MMKRKILQPEQKALEINLNKKIYGAFAEIGAGQEVARNFFQAGAAAGTIAKTMSAYDKLVSDDIYGAESSGRYVCENRLYKMLDHEYKLLQERLQDHEDYNFFAFADTVAAINYSRTIKGNGWLGIRFRLNTDSEPNDLVIHAKMLDNSNSLQQEAIGILGVNMLYACFKYHDNMEDFVRSLMDNIKDRINVDLIRLTGPDFKDVDNRLLSLYQVKYGLTEVAMFDSSGTPIHASEFLYKKHLMVVRGHFRPPTLVTEDVFESGYKQFISREEVDENKTEIVAEITLDNLELNGEISDVDFLWRAKMIGALGHKVIISNCDHHQKLINYLSDYKIKNLGLLIGAKEITAIIKDKYEEHQDGSLLVAFGQLFTRNIIVYVYPVIENDVMTTADSLDVPEGILFLHKHLLDANQIVGIEGYNEDLLRIFPHNVLEKICTKDVSWKEQVPHQIVPIIEEREFEETEKKAVLDQY